ncbi:MAG TPA: LysM peptidoglycan-binding domain-containing protein [Terriglobia bacterium]|nr:LysM peptidoglycan-binding domain-containing protein [Terriglobia bacterium]
MKIILALDKPMCYKLSQLELQIASPVEIRNLMLQGTKRQIDISLVLFAGIFILGVAPSLAQSVADVARQERARQKNISHPAQHVYTNEDLQRSQILVPEDRARIEVGRKAPASLTEPQPGTVTSGSSHAQEIPLGDVARHYRQLYQLQEIQQADKSDVLPGKKPALASPTSTRPAIIFIPKPRWTQPRHAVLPESGENVTLHGASRILINQGDSLWMLAARYLGRGTRWHKILAANPQLKNPNLIRAGEWITLPLGDSAPINGKISVRKGDTLWKLAQLNFGNGLAWSCIAEANPLVANANRIYSGQVLTLPARCASTR